MMRDLGTLVQTLEFEKIQECGNSDLVGLEWSGFDPQIHTPKSWWSSRIPMQF